MSTTPVRAFLDGSNLILGVTPNGDPSVYAFACIFDMLTARGFSASAVFDYSIQYRLKDRGAPAEWDALDRLRVASRGAINLTRYADDPLLSAADASGGFVVTHADDYKQWTTSHGKRPRLIRVTGMQDMLSFSFPDDEARSFSVKLPESVTLFGQQFTSPMAVISPAVDPPKETSATQSRSPDDRLDQFVSNATSDITATSVSEAPSADERVLIERTVSEFTKSWAHTAPPGRLLAILNQSPLIPTHLNRQLSRAVSGALGRRNEGVVYKQMRAAFWRTLEQINQASLQPSAQQQSEPIVSTTRSSQSLAEGQAISQQHERPFVELAEDSPRNRPVEGAERPTTSDVLGRDTPTPDDLALIERTAREFAESWARTATPDQLREILRELPMIPRDLYVGLLSAVSGALRRPITGRYPFVDPMRTAFWRTLKQSSRASLQPTRPPSSPTPVTFSPTTPQLSADDAELQSEVAGDPPRNHQSAIAVSALVESEPAALLAAAEEVEREVDEGPANANRREASIDKQSEARPAAPILKPVGRDLPKAKKVTTTTRKSAAPRRPPANTSKRVYQFAKDIGVGSAIVTAQLGTMGYMKTASSAIDDELVMRLLEPRAMQEMQDRVADIERRRFEAEEEMENPKLLECRDCRRYFQFPYKIRSIGL